MFGATLTLDWLPTLRDLPAVGSHIVSPEGNRLTVERVTQIEPGRYVVAGKPIEARKWRYVPVSTAFMFFWDGENA